MINNYFRPAVVLNGRGSRAEIHHTTVAITENDLDRAADQLADAVGTHWYAEADSRGLLKRGVPVRWRVSRRRLTTRVAAATAERGTPRFPPLPGVVPVTEDGWAPDDERRDVVDWAVERPSRLHKGHRHLRQLLATGRIALFLDGFDEVHEEVRPLAVAALESAPFRVVLISRTEEAADTAARELPAGAVALELEPVRPADAASYHPLTVSLLAEVYAPRGPVEELFDLTGPDAVRDHLLDHAVAAAYTRRPRPHGCRPYRPETAERTLRHLAARLTEDGTAELHWWRIPSWPGRRFRVWITGTAVTVVYLTTVLLTLAPWIGPLWAAVAALMGWTLGTLDAAIRMSRLHHQQRLTSAGWRDMLPLLAITGGLFDWIMTTGPAWLLLRFAGHPQSLLLCCLLGLPYGFGGALPRGRAVDLVARTIVAPFRLPAPLAP
ncbi:hypothetical protein ACIBEA_15725 [Streptomyces sp. NPDC051555]|uniref:hypothetical protein n=1 Tax=Streptomyces sp. NPDC051555 TaxID=3365657 RepID=UPI0037BD5918